MTRVPSSSGYTSNGALIIADIFADPLFGLGDSVNTDQLIAAANVCDESVALAAGGTEARYACHWNFDTSTAPGDAIQQFLMGMGGGRISRIGGEWYIWPGYWQGPSFTFDESSLVGPMQWSPTRSFRDLINRVNGTYIAPNYPYNVAGNLYDSNGYYNGMTADNWPFAFQPTNFPQYASDVLHGYASDQYLNEDSGVSGSWSSTTTYADGAVILYSNEIYISLQNSNLNNTPSSATAWWAPYSVQLPKELTLSTVLSIAQAQRCAKIMLLRNRYQGSGVFPLQLACWQMQPTDVMQFSFAAAGWTDKVLECNPCASVSIRRVARAPATMKNKRPGSTWNAPS